LTANALKGDRERFLSEGLDEYVSKPIEMNELLYVLNKFLATKAVIGNTPHTQPTPTPTIHKSDTVSMTPTSADIATEPSFAIHADSVADVPQTNTAPHPQSTTSVSASQQPILVAKRSKLSSKIIERLLEALQRDAVSVSDTTAFDQALSSQPFAAIFADEDFVTTTNKPILLQHRTPIILTTQPENTALFEGLNYRQVDSVLSQSALLSILNTME
jgi:CheY-like chemotaxis protein